MRKEAQCILGNGVCPETCDLNNTSVKVTEALGQDFKPSLSRLTLLFADAFNPDLNIFDVARVADSCEREAQKQKAQI